MKTKLLFIGICMLTLFACKKTDPSPTVPTEPIDYTISFANILDAQSLFITEIGGNTKSQSTSTNLFKITGTGKIDSVVFTNKNGDTITAVVHFIRNLSDKYVYVSLSNYRDHLIRKTDGAAFEVNSFQITPQTRTETDYRQNVYFTGPREGGEKLYKMYDYNNNVDIAQITKDYMTVNHYLVDQKGNVLMDVNNSQSNSRENYCYLSSGEFAKSKWGPSYGNYNKYYSFTLKEEPENFYALSGLGDYGYKSIIKIKATIPELTSETIFDTLQMDGEDAVLSLHRLYNLRSADMTIFLMREQVGNDIIFSMENEKSYKLIPLSKNCPKFNKELKSIKGYIYGFNSDEIFRINIATGNIETVYTNVEYSIHDFNVNNDQVITFSALELRKAQDVVCEIRNGQLNVLETDDSQKILQLERIN